MTSLWIIFSSCFCLFIFAKTYGKSIKSLYALHLCYLCLIYQQYCKNPHQSVGTKVSKVLLREKILMPLCNENVIVFTKWKTFLYKYWSTKCYWNLEVICFSWHANSKPINGKYQIYLSKLKKMKSCKSTLSLWKKNPKQNKRTPKS